MVRAGSRNLWRRQIQEPYLKMQICFRKLCTQGSSVWLWQQVEGPTGNCQEPRNVVPLSGMSSSALVLYEHHCTWEQNMSPTVQMYTAGKIRVPRGALMCISGEKCGQFALQRIYFFSFLWLGQVQGRKQCHCLFDKEKEITCFLFHLLNFVFFQSFKLIFWKQRNSDVQILWFSDLEETSMGN